MSVYKKIQTVAVELQQAPLQKSGHNKFAGFKYFELADFLPTINELFLKHGLAGFCSFNNELATLTVVDSESGDKVEVTSPMVEIEMKGANAIQALGAVETYSRRYLYLALLGIVENDVADATSHDTTPVKTKPQASQSTSASEKQLLFLNSLVNDTNRDAILGHYKVNDLSELTGDQASDLIKRLKAKQ